MIVRHVAEPERGCSVPGRRSERGETLIEVLTMVVLMGVGFAAIFGGMMTVSRVNDLNKKRTQASNAVQAWAEGLQQPATSLTGSPSNPYTYKPCATAATYANTGQPNGSMPASWQAEAMNNKPVKVEYFTGTYGSGGEPQFTDDVNVCYSYQFGPLGGGTKDRGLQRITIKVETPAGVTPRVADTLVIIKRDQSCPPVTNTDGSSRFDNADLGPC